MWCSYCCSLSFVSYMMRVFCLCLFLFSRSLWLASVLIVFWHPSVLFLPFGFCIFFPFVFSWLFSFICDYYPRNCWLVLPSSYISFLLYCLHCSFLHIVGSELLFVSFSVKNSNAFRLTCFHWFLCSMRCSYLFFLAWSCALYVWYSFYC